MIEKFLGLRIKGRCFEQETQLKFFPGETQRVSMVFGRNGSGKSTVSRTFARLAVDGPKYDGMEMVDILGRDHSEAASTFLPPAQFEGKIKVFNEDYVREKVVLEKDDAKGIGTIVYLGEQKAYDDKIKKLTGERGQIVASIERCKNALADFENEENPLSLPAIRQSIISTLRDDELKLGWAYRNAQIAGKGTPPTDVTNETVQSIIDAPCAESGKVSMDEFNEKLDEKAKRAFQLERDLPPLEFGDVLDFNIDGLYKLLSANLEHDPESRKDYQRRLINMRNVIPTPREFDLTAYEELDANTTRKTRDCLRALTMNFRNLRSCCSYRLRHPYDSYTEKSCRRNDITRSVQQLKQLLQVLSEKRRQYITREMAERERELIELNKQVAKRQISKDYKILQSRQRKYEEKLDELKTLNKELQVKDSVIEEQKKIARKDITIAADQINAALKYIFLSDKRIQLEAQDGVYKVKSHGRDVAPYDVSVGERNVLALCYFFADLFKDGNAKDSYKDERLIVLDDPVSSFDHENKMGVLSYIMFEIENLTCTIFKDENNKEIRPETRVICMVHELYTYFALANAIQTHDNKSKKPDIGLKLYSLDCRETSLVSFSWKLDDINEYRENFNDIMTYAELKDPAPDIHVGNQTRRLLEAFSTFVFRKGIEYLFYTKDIIKNAHKEDFHRYYKEVFSRFVVNDESHLQGRIRSLTNGNCLLPFIHQDAQQRAVRDAICLIYLIMPEHILSLFKDENVAKAKAVVIEKWIQKIRADAPAKVGGEA